MIDLTGPGVCFQLTAGQSLADEALSSCFYLYGKKRISVKDDVNGFKRYCAPCFSLVFKDFDVCNDVCGSKTFRKDNTSNIIHTFKRNNTFPCPNFEEMY